VIDGTVAWARNALLVAGLLLSSGVGQAALFSDDEARKAIIDLRQRVEAQKATAEAIEKRLTDENNQLRRSLLDLQNQIETLRAEQARMRGQGEQMSREIAETQRRQTTQTQSLDERLRSMEPQKVTLDGREFVATPAEMRDFDAAMGVFRSGDFQASQAAFLDFAKRFPKSGYYPSALFWLGNAQYATRDYKEAITNFRSLLTLAPDHARAPEAILSIANCQIELKDNKAARRTLEDLIRLHPQSEAAQAAKERLAKLR
jgi:tol-pal system protein YbgF